MSAVCAPAAAITLLLLAACGGATTPDTGPADAGSTAPLGGFAVTLVAAAGTSPAYTSILGKVYGGPVPEATVWTVMEEGAGCQLLVPRVPFCSTDCGGSAACVDGDRCAPYPAAQDVGRVHVTGVGAAFDMEPIAGNYQPAAGFTRAYPPFGEGAPIRMTAPGGRLGAFSLEGRGITPLVFEQTPAPRMGQPLRLAWTPAGQPELGRIEVKLDVSHHGGARGKIECDVPDTGSLEIPAAQVSGLLALGVAGFPTIVVTRVATATAAVPAGIVALRVLSPVERAVDIEGLRSCTGDGQCSAGQRCGADLTCN
jgi:hypothetical protein